MRDLMRQLMTELDSGRELAWCRLVETRGSTPQKAGALMAVRPDGSQLGTVGGGCVEAEVKRRALAVLHGATHGHGRPSLESFQLDSDYGWDDGLICGGRMLFLIVPLRGAVPAYFRELTRLCDSGQALTEALVFDSAASGLAAPSAWLFDSEHRLAAAWPNDVMPDDAAGTVPDAVQTTLPPIGARRRPFASHGVAYLPLQTRCRLVIVGGGHVGKAVADLAYDLEFDVWVVDDREPFVSAERFPRAVQRIAGPVDDVLPRLEITPDTFCLIVTRGHNHDEEALYHLADRGARYVGLIGSRRKIKLIFDDLLEKGVSAAALKRVHAPLGVDIGSQTVPEIAISIAAELVAFRNLDGQVPGRPHGVEVS